MQRLGEVCTYVGTFYICVYICICIQVRKETILRSLLKTQYNDGIEAFRWFIYPWKSKTIKRIAPLQVSMINHDDRKVRRLTHYFATKGFFNDSCWIVTKHTNMTSSMIVNVSFSHLFCFFPFFPSPFCGWIPIPAVPYIRRISEGSFVLKKQLHATCSTGKLKENPVAGRAGSGATQWKCGTSWQMWQMWPLSYSLDPM